MVERDAGDVDCAKPVLDLRLCAFALPDEQLAVEDPPPVVLGQRSERLLVAADLDRELAGDEPADARDALLAVENLEAASLNVEVDQPKRVALEQRVDDRDVFLAVVVDVVALELRLD